MERCYARTQSGRRCKNTVRQGHTLCGIHQPANHEVRCTTIQRNGVQCHAAGQHQVNGEWMCIRHYNIMNERVMHQAAEDMLNDILRDLGNGMYIRDLEDRVIHGFEVGIYDERHRDTLLDILYFEHGLIELHQAPINIADDPQNVHRKEVSEQTNKGLDILLNVPVPSNQNVLESLKKLNVSKSIQQDVRRWYKQSYCREVDDWLYKRALDGLWAYVQTSNYKDELFKRFIEEATDSLQMCCDGHITRLVNVLVGFDERVAPPIPVGELLQQKIAVISAKEISIHEKVMEALICMSELKIPHEEQTSWIEAL